MRERGGRRMYLRVDIEEERGERRGTMREREGGRREIERGRGLKSKRGRRVRR